MQHKFITFATWRNDTSNGSAKSHRLKEINITPQLNGHLYLSTTLLLLTFAEPPF